MYFNHTLYNNWLDTTADQSHMLQTNTFGQHLHTDDTTVNATRLLWVLPGKALMTVMKYKHS